MHRVIGTFLGLAWFATCVVGGVLALEHAFKRDPQVLFALFPLCLVAWVLILAGGGHVFCALTRFLAYPYRKLVGFGSPLQESYAVFIRELPDLVRNHVSGWVVYYKGERLGIAPTAEEAERIAIKRGISEHETFVQAIPERAPISSGWSSLGWR